MSEFVDKGSVAVVYKESSAIKGGNRSETHCSFPNEGRLIMFGLIALPPIRASFHSS